MYRTIGDYRFEFYKDNVRITYRETQAFSVNNYYLLNKRSINSFKKEVLKKRTMDYPTLIQMTKSHNLNFAGSQRAYRGEQVSLIW